MTPVLVRIGAPLRARIEALRARLLSGAELSQSAVMRLALEAGVSALERRAARPKGKRKAPR